MRLTVVGCAGSFPGPDSPASCYLVQAESEGRWWSVLLDLGNGALGPLQRLLDPSDLDAILLSHLHPDHCADITGLYVIQNYRPDRDLCHPIPVWAPAGAVEHVTALSGGSTIESVERAFAAEELADRAPVVVGPFTITPFAVRHPVPAFGFRVEAGGVVLAYSGDTDACPALSPLLAGADLALVECAFVDGRDDAVEGIHLTGSRAAQAAIDAGGVRRLMLTHLPAWNDPEVCRAQAATLWPGQVELARTGQIIDL